MRKKYCLFLAFVICLSLFGCADADTAPESVPTTENTTEKAYEISKKAYENINDAYSIVEEFSINLYEAWRIGISHGTEVRNGGCAYLANLLTLSEEEIREGAVYLNHKDNWENATEEEKAKTRLIADEYFRWTKYLPSILTANVVPAAYKMNGKEAEIQSKLDKAKDLMLVLGEEYPDYAYTQDIRAYHTTVTSFFNYCVNPFGTTFDQSVVTINDYKNEVRDHKSNLDFVFSD